MFVSRGGRTSGGRRKPRRRLSGGHDLNAVQRQMRGGKPSGGLAALTQVVVFADKAVEAHVPCVDSCVAAVAVVGDREEFSPDVREVGEDVHGGGDCGGGVADGCLKEGLHGLAVPPRSVIRG